MRSLSPFSLWSARSRGPKGCDSQVRYDPRQVLEQELPHVTLVVTRLPKGRAWWLPEEDAVVVDDRLDAAGQRCAVAHELEHVVAGDVPLPHRWFSTKQERQADRRADPKLVHLDDLVDQLLWSRHELELAEGLQVTPEVLRRRLDALSEEEHRYVEDRVWMAEHEMHP